MIKLATNSSNDIFISPSGKLSMATGIDSVLQTCEHVVKTMLGELILQPDDGMPNFELIWNGSPNVIQYKAALHDKLMNVTGVVDVLNIEIVVKNNTLEYNARISTIYGEGVISGI